MSKNFKQFLSPQNLDRLMGEGYGVKIRLCFSYIYSDYPICLVRAENEVKWRNKSVDSYYDFDEANSALNRDQLLHSTLAKSQKYSLESIATLINDNDNLIITDGKNKYDNMHTIQVRFACIPVGPCTLRINDTFFCDSYLYASIPKEKVLSVHYPLCVIKNNKEQLKQFNSVKDNFEYLWKHDLTLFCGDVTNYTCDNHIGLATINEPFEEDMITPNITWNHKIKVIIDKKLEKIRARKIRKYPSDITKDELLILLEPTIIKWKANLNERLHMCTRKLKPKIGKNREKKKVFIIMTLDKAFDNVFSIIEKQLLNKGFKVIRITDEDEDSKTIIPQKIRTEIDDSDLVVAELTKGTPNCYFEVGYAIAKGKNLMLLAAEESRPKIHYDLKLNGFRYWKDLTDLESKLKKRLDNLYGFK